LEGNRDKRGNLDDDFCILRNYEYHLFQRDTIRRQFSGGTCQKSKMGLALVHFHLGIYQIGISV
jgi:hypothetical protein